MAATGVLRLRRPHTPGLKPLLPPAASWPGWLVAAAGPAVLLPVVLVLGIGGIALVGALLLIMVLGQAVRSPLWAVGTFVLAIPFGLSQALSIGRVDLVQVLAAGVVVLVAWQRLLSGRAPLRWHPSARWAVALAVLAVVSAVTALDVVVAVRQVVALVVAVLLALAVNAACARGDDLRRLVMLLALVGTGVALYSLGQSGEIQAVAANAGAVDNRAVGIFSSPNELGMFSGMLALVGIALAVGASNRAERIVGAVCALASVAALTVSLSRGGWIGAALAVVLLAILSARARRTLVVVLVIAAVGTPLVLARTAPQLWDVVTERAATIFDPAANPDDARPLIYQEAGRQAFQRPFTGQGPGNYPIAAQTAESAAPAVHALHAHNVLLDAAAETGIPGAAALVGLTLSVTWRVLRARTRLPARDADLMIGLACTLVVMVGQGLVDFPFRNPTLLFLVWLLLGLLFAATTPSSDRGPGRRPRAAGVSAMSPAQTGRSSP